MSRVKVDLMTGLYGDSVERMIDRVQNSLRRGYVGDYGFDQYFRDWFQGFSDVVLTSHANCQILVGQNQEIVMEGAEKEKDVRDAFAFATPANAVLKNGPLQPAVGRERIDFSVKPNHDHRAIIVVIPDLKHAVKGKSYTAKIWNDAVGPEAILTLRLNVV